MADVFTEINAMADLTVSRTTYFAGQAPTGEGSGAGRVAGGSLRDLPRGTTSDITASTTQTQGQQALTSELNQISACANANDVVTLPAAAAGASCTIINNGTNTLQVFPASGDNLGLGVDVSTTIGVDAYKRWVAYDATNWEDVSAAVPGVLSPERFGAVADGTTDDTVAVQAALTAAGNAGGKVVFTPGKTYRITNNLFAFGNSHIEGYGATLLFNANVTQARYAWAFGTKAFGATSGNGLVSRWIGSLKGLRIVTQAPLSGATDAVIGLIECEDARIEDVCFDHTAITTGYPHSIAAQVDSAWIDTFHLESVRISRVRVKAAASTVNENEGILLTNADRVWVTDCEIFGVADDGISFHDCIECVCRGNVVATVDGGIFFSVTRGVLEGNIVRHITTAEGNPTTSIGGLGLIKGFPEDTNQPAPSDIAMVGNVLVHNEDNTALASGATIEGWRRAVIVGNVMYDVSGFGQGINIKGYDGTAITWSDPEGVDVGVKANAREILAVGNAIWGVQDDNSPVTTVQTTGSDLGEWLVFVNNASKRDPELTIEVAGNIADVREDLVIVDSNADDPADNLDSLTWRAEHANKEVTIRTAADARVITVRDAAVSGGNIFLRSGPFVMDSTKDKLKLRGADRGETDGWYEISRSKIGSWAIDDVTFKGSNLLVNDSSDNELLKVDSTNYQLSWIVPDGANSATWIARFINNDITNGQGNGVLVQAGNGSSDVPLSLRARVGTEFVRTLGTMAIVMAQLPTVDPVSANQLWNSSADMLVSTG